MLDRNEPEFWVLLAFVLFVGLFAKNIWKLLAGVLDSRSDKIRSELNAAKNLRAEAEAVLALYKQKQLEFAKEAQDILTKAKEDAYNNTKLAQAELKIALDARMKNALEKISQEETAAISEVRNHIVEIALAAARTIILTRVEQSTNDELVRVVVSDIERKIIH